jgi:hypothetical protein
MGLIKINPSELSKVSTKLGVNAARVSATSNFIKLAGLLARTYAKNSFGPQVKAICNEGQNRGSHLGVSLYSNSGILKLIALDFSVVDNKFLRGIINKIKALFPQSDSGDILTGISTTNPAMVTTGSANEEKATTPKLTIGLSQSDKQWNKKEDSMGVEGHYIKDLGCLITCVAMIGRLHGEDVTPKDINDYLKKINGYVAGTSYLKWDSAEKWLESISGKSYSYQEISSSKVSEMVESGDPVIIHVRVPYNDNNGGDGHWVLAHSYDKSTNTFKVYESGTGKESTYSANDLMAGHKVFSSNN